MVGSTPILREYGIDSTQVTSMQVLYEGYVDLKIKSLVKVLVKKSRAKEKDQVDEEKEESDVAEVMDQQIHLPQQCPACSV